jgi:hypothetical protein
MESNDGYQWDNRTNVQYARDQFGRRSASEIGIPSSRGRYFHIYLNGVYWGVYNVVERPDVSFGKTHFGAEKEDWDGINFGTPTNDSLEGFLEYFGESCRGGEQRRERISTDGSLHESPGAQSRWLEQ